MAVESSKYNHLKAPVITFMAVEGAFTAATSEDAGGGTRANYSGWATPIVKGGLLKLSSTSEWTVDNRGTGDTDLIGIAHEKPRWMNADAKAPTGDIASPTDEDRRSVAVQAFMLWVRAVVVDGTGTAPTLGQSVAPSGDAGGLNEWVQDTTRNNSITIVVGTDDVEDTIVGFYYNGAF